MWEGLVLLAILLVVVGLALWVAFLLLRLSPKSLRDVFSRDLGVLRRRLLVGLADFGYAFFAGYFFFSGEIMVPLVQPMLAVVCLVVFVTGLTLWLLAGFQLFGLLFLKPKETPAELPPQSNP